MSSGSARLSKARQRLARAAGRLGPGSHAPTAARSNGQTIELDYPVDPKPRYGYGKPAHPQLEAMLQAHDGAFASQLEAFVPLVDDLLEIPLVQADETTPWWHNGWYQGLDAVSLYGLLTTRSPRRYLEIGSGNSTKFARRAVTDQNLKTTIHSIDPQPRAEIDALCDQVTRAPLESVDLSVFDVLDSGDFLFFDGSHRVFQNSDVAAFFLDVLPRLPPGIVVHIHDIFLPWDYPPQIGQWYFSEQYMLATHLLARGDRLEVVLPNFYISVTPPLHRVLASLWDRFTWSNTPVNGTGIWLQTT